MHTTAPRITTSWDDGHPADLRLAELLSRYGVPATFYIPRSNPLDDLPVMSEAEIQSLAARGFEIGAHTLEHRVLTDTPDEQVRAELSGSKQWVEGLTGRPCPMFSPPNGRFASRHVAMICDAGFAGFRTTELWSVDAPRLGHNGLMELPTTLQAHPQPTRGTVRNLVKRRALTNAGHYLKFGRDGDWATQARAMIDHVVTVGRGVFHLWGHSWELEDADQWDRLETVLAEIRRVASSAKLGTNTGICSD